MQERIMLTLLKRWISSMTKCPVPKFAPYRASKIAFAILSPREDGEREMNGLGLRGKQAGQRSLSCARRSPEN